MTSVPVGKQFVAVAVKDGIELRRRDGAGKPFLLRWADVKTLASDAGAMIGAADLLTFAEIAELADMSLGSVYHACYIGQHDFPPVVHRVGVTKYFERQAVIEWNERRLASPRAKRRASQYQPRF